MQIYFQNLKGKCGMETSDKLSMEHIIWSSIKVLELENSVTDSVSNSRNQETATILMTIQKELFSFSSTYTFYILLPMYICKFPSLILIFLNSLIDFKKPHVLAKLILYSKNTF